ncbi:agmatine deiminase family protein [bacterium BMS3Abin03]|jgi:agmatine deiminase|nr:agmatine deiminase family protein [bacterium BMS3Abin03]
MSKLRLPAEWEPHEATWLGFPHNTSDWPGKFPPIKWVYGEIVKFISRGEKVRIFVQSKEHKSQAENVFKSVGVGLNQVEFFIKKTNRGWLRDSSPQYVKDGNKIIAVDFKFSAWAKYNNYKLDNQIPSFISKKIKLKKIEAAWNDKQIVLEGGSIDTNGKGTLITTEECLLDQKNQVRNPELTEKDYEEIFEKYLGITNTIWLKNGITGDDTHGHVDDLCRFVHKDTVVLVCEENPIDKNYKPLKENKELLEVVVLKDGSKLNVIDLPMPSPVIFKGQRLPASYANFYISNYAVLVPTFNDPNDRNALGILSELFPDRKVIGIHSVDLVWGLGTIHCLTKEQPE